MERELCPRYFWLVTSPAREHVGTEELLARYRALGKAENTFGELKSTLRAQLPFSPRPRRQYADKTIDRSEPPVRQVWRPHNEAFLLLALLAYQTMHEGRCATEGASGGWSLGGSSQQVERQASAQPIRRRVPESYERFFPLQTGKSGHVSIGRVKFGLVLDRQGSKVRVRRQVASNASRFTGSDQNVCMMVSRVSDYTLRSFEPSSNSRAGTADAEGILENRRIRGDADETQDGNPRKAYTFGSVHQRFPPFARPCADRTANRGRAAAG